MIGTKSANATEFTDTGVPPGVYNYSVEAYNSAGAWAQVTMKVTVCS
ncbi:MAG: hypothetical protein IIC79_05825 [Chloroflexi bacterium]|nr:hypothetical protein [Chloroflexota bacterium]